MHFGQCRTVNSLRQKGGEIGKKMDVCCLGTLQHLQMFAMRHFFANWWAAKASIFRRLRTGMLANPLTREKKNIKEILLRSQFFPVRFANFPVLSIVGICQSTQKCVMDIFPTIYVFFIGLSSLCLFIGLSSLCLFIGLSSLCLFIDVSSLCLFYRPVFSLTYYTPVEILLIPRKVYYV